MSGFGFRRRRVGRRGFSIAVPVLLVTGFLWFGVAGGGTAQAGVPTVPPLPTLPPTPTLTPIPLTPPPVPPVPAPPLPPVPGVPLPGAPNPGAIAPPAGAAPGAAPAAGAPGQQPPGAAGGASAALLPAGSLGALFSSLDPQLASQLQGIFTRPEAIQPPSLQHITFTVRGTPGQGGPSDLARSASPNRAPLGLVIAVAVLLIAAISLVLAGDRRRRLFARLARSRWLTRGSGRLPAPLAAAMVLMLGAMVSGPVLRSNAVSSHGNAPAPAPTQSTVQVASRDLSAVTVQSGDAPPGAAPQAGATQSGSKPAPPPAPAGSVAVRPVVLTNLEQIENRLLLSRQRVLADQATVHSLATMPASPAPPGPAVVDRPASRLSPQAQLTHAMADESAASTDYQTAMKDEYAYFTTVAGDPQARAQLIAAVQQLHDPAAAQAVLYNLQVIDTAQAQEAAIRAAEASQPFQAPNLPLVPGQSSALRPPLSAPISQPFGPTSFSLEPPHTFNGVFYPHFHTGTDFAGPMDAPIAAAADGVVVLAGNSVNGAGQLVGYGHYVVIQHANGYRTLYGHLDQILVKTGQTVAGGQPIGLEGSTGWSTGAHLHFEVRRGEEPVDPMPYLTGQAGL